MKYRLLKIIDTSWSSIPVWDDFTITERDIFRLDNWQTIPISRLIEHGYIEAIDDRKYYLPIELQQDIIQNLLDTCWCIADAPIIEKLKNLQLIE